MRLSKAYVDSRMEAACQRALALDVCSYRSVKSILKTGKAKAIRFSTLEAVCRELDCQPGDILEYSGEATL